MPRRRFALPQIAPDIVGHTVISLAEMTDEDFATLERKLGEENYNVTCIPFAMGELLTRDEKTRKLLIKASLLTLVALNDQMLTDILEEVRKKRVTRKRVAKKRTVKMVAKKRRLRSV